MPRKYSTVERHVWRDPDVHRMDRLTKLLWVHLLTSGFYTNITGLLPASLAMVADELREDLNDEFRQSVQILVDMGWIKVDTDARLIFLPGALRHNPPGSPNEVIGWGNSFVEIPDSPLRLEWLEALVTTAKEHPWKRRDGDSRETPSEVVDRVFGSYIEAPPKVLGKVLGKVHRTPDPDPDPEPEPKANTQTRTRARGTYKEEFERLWQVHPKKKSKRRAAKAFNAAVKSADWPGIDAVIEKIEQEKQSWDWTKKEGQYVPHLASWLNDGGWMNEPSTPSKPQDRQTGTPSPQNYV